jgi:cation diffusion facilitator CzcD-associated flavoprotein CzcO
VIVFATGFQTHGFVTPMEVTGKDDRTLAQAWAGAPRAYLGLSTPGFPNLFLLYGPNTGGGAGSVLYMIDAGMRHVISALEALGQADAQRIEIRRQAADSFDTELRAALTGTVWHSGCTNCTSTKRP